MRERKIRKLGSSAVLLVLIELQHNEVYSLEFSPNKIFRNNKPSLE